MATEAPLPQQGFALVQFKDQRAFLENARDTKVFALILSMMQKDGWQETVIKKTREEAVKLAIIPDT